MSVLDDPVGSRTASSFERVRLELERDVIDKLAARRRAEVGAEPERVGVVFVHGIGSQAASTTLRDFADPLVDWIERWAFGHEAPPLQHRHRPKVLWSRLTYGESERAPARIALFLPGSTEESVAHGDQIWVLAEAWWAARLEAPPLRVMTRWAWRVGFRTLFDLIGERFDRLGRDQAPPLRRAIEGLSAVLLILGLGAAALFLVAPLALLSVIAQAPIPVLERFIVVRLLAPFLTQALGDHYVFTYDEIQREHIIRSVAETLRWLVREHRCSRVVVVGHSQGGVVAYDACFTYKTPSYAPSVAADFAAVKGLITLGSALNVTRGAIARAARALRNAAPGVLALVERPRPLPARTRDLFWLDVWADYDPVAGGPLRPQDADESLSVTNGLNVITDHGAYTDNYEEVISRLAREIDRTGAQTASRFYTTPADLAHRVARRRFRVLVLVAWRVAAIVAFFFALVVRTYGPNGIDLVADGRIVWGRLVGIPGFGDLIGLPGGVLAALQPGPDSYRAVRDLLAGRSLDLLAALHVALGIVLQLGEVLLMGLVGLAVIGGAFALLYVIVGQWLYVPWNEAESRASVAPIPPAPDRFADAARIIGVFVAVAVLTAILLRLPALGDLLALLPR